MGIFKKIAASYNRKRPFVAYVKPNESIISGFFLENDNIQHVKNYTNSGFVFAPFSHSEDAILFPSEQSEILNEPLYLNTDLSTKQTSILAPSISFKAQHIKIISKAIEEIKKNTYSKIVISRCEEIKLQNFDVLSVFTSLLSNYRNAFVYVWFHPKVGLWLGATPETLLQVSEKSFKTMSLAGTQLYQKNKKPNWKNKELEEQRLVTNFIKNQLEPISNDLKVDDLETVRAGSLLHLRTKVDGNLKQNISLEKLIRAIHPTPAVCGLPREKSKDFILKNETYDRAFYTGFLGELNLTNQSSLKKSSLFVNLRCMSIHGKTARVYVGGGITKDSDPEKEWLETVVKTKTMKNVL